MSKNPKFIMIQKLLSEQQLNGQRYSHRAQSRSNTQPSPLFNSPCSIDARWTLSQMTALTPRIDFSNLNGESLWCIFETKAYYGGALAYAVLSRASKMDCACCASLAKGSEGRRKQKEEWLRWTAKFCNLFWAKYYSFQVVSQRHSYKNKLDSFW